VRSLIWIVTILAAVATSGDALAQSAGPFEGKWTTVVSCRAAEGAGSFTLLVDADVKGGVFSGEKGDKGKPRQRHRPFVEIGGGECSRGHGIRLSRHGPIGRHEGDRRSAGRPSLQRDFHQTVTSR
jgi:hypothetical protein